MTQKLKEISFPNRCILNNHQELLKEKYYLEEDLKKLKETEKIVIIALDTGKKLEINYKEWFIGTIENRIKAINKKIR